MLGGDEPPPTDASNSTREQRLFVAAARRVAGVRCILEKLENGGNRAAILRSMEALGLLHVHEVAPQHVHPDRGRARGVAHGGEKWLEMHAHATASDLRIALEGITVLAALPPASEAQVSTSWHALGSRRRRKRDANESVDAPAALEPTPPAPPLPPALAHPVALEDVDFSRPVALAFGNERLGLSAELLAVCDGAFHIPLYGLTESLNVSVAVAIALHHGRLARTTALRAAGTLNKHGGDLDEIGLASLVDEYARRGKHFAKGGAGEGGATADGDAG